MAQLLLSFLPTYEQPLQSHVTAGPVTPSSVPPHELGEDNEGAREQPHYPSPQLAKISLAPHCPFLCPASLPDYREHQWPDYSFPHHTRSRCFSVAPFRLHVHTENIIPFHNCTCPPACPLLDWPSPVWRRPPCIGQPKKMQVLLR